MDLESTIKKFHEQIQNGVDEQHLRRFKTIIKNYYKTHGRHFSWRSNISPYSILVSEIMLQQTQTSRVVQKYTDWMNAFPDFKTLAKAPLSKVLKVWQGMGYNRRAVALKKCAEIIVTEHKNILPDNIEELVKLPQVGPNTAASIAAFAYNKPTVFVETNIRSVFITFFFPNKTDVHDTDILELVEQTVDTKNPREWYYALMDYGVLLKKTFENPNKKSKHYSKQSTFKGSNRELRGAILRELNSSNGLTLQKLHKKLVEKKFDIANVQKNLDGLMREGFIGRNNKRYFIL